MFAGARASHAIARKRPLFYIGSDAFAGQLAGLLHPRGELNFVELAALADIEAARVLAIELWY